MEIWSHEGKRYELISTYSGSDDAWYYQVRGLAESCSAEPNLTVAIPDATPEGSFTPMSAQHIVFYADGGVLPWPILGKLIHLLESRGDLVEEQRDRSSEAIALPLTLTSWSHDGRRFEVNQFHHGDAGSWSYELYELDSDTPGNNYIEVRIPDASPESGSFVPMPAAHVTLTMHGHWALPWPVFRRFLDAIQAAGDIVEPSDEPPIVP
ncbi:hypothetical protein BJY16_004622 [Actinoplanes octamycinicus]|uniref:Uncharacterized protein n=1 Tax=Actinoplanes octamycinicus TaxID=135948 RepID=A0A7W7GZJ6_9ACTN|nr:hypothetical protein [Actinoplanes octamycinicus]MBB4741163.1 hypothetical protein [Actinoplanes octamycinicus]GIE56070.1 hypothetical protein Aoc01nite_14720 [Actinoplanes octamycinicus]